MKARILGSAAGGGFPQWNCGCPACRAARSGFHAVPRTQSSVAVSGDGERWFLLNASPDIRGQLAASPALQPCSMRESRIEAVLLTDAELDHTLGLLMIREGRKLAIHATPAVHRTLTAGSRILCTLEAYCGVDWHPVRPGAETSLALASGEASGLGYRAFDTGSGKPDRFTGIAAGESVVGYRLTDSASGRSLVYLPGVQRLDPHILDELEGCSCLLIDGTCWQDDELIQLGVGAKTARDMGHVPIDGPGGSLAILADLAIERKIYTHINNTNPILLEDSAERAAVEARGLEVAVDGMEIEI